MYSRLAARPVRRTFKRLAAGDAQAPLRMFARGARFVFPGRHSFAADTRDRREIDAWFERFAALGPHVEVSDVLAAGPPWNMRVAVRFTDTIATPDGPDYTNEGMQYLRLRWGRATLDQIYLDTQAVAAADESLSGVSPPS